MRTNYGPRSTQRHGRSWPGESGGPDPPLITMVTCKIFINPMTIFSHRVPLMHTLRGRSRAGAVRSGAVRAVAVRTGPKLSAQSRPKQKSTRLRYRLWTNISRVRLVRFCPNFQRPWGEGQLLRAEKIQNLTREFRENRGQSTPRSKISTPHISPKWGAVSYTHLTLPTIYSV